MISYNAQPPNQIVYDFVSLPEELRSKIFGYLTPRHLAKCCLISKIVNDRIHARNQSNMKYWFQHLSRTVYLYSSNVRELKDAYGRYYVTEKAARQYFKCMHHLDVVANPEDYYALYILAKRYVENEDGDPFENPKALWLYYTAYYGYIIYTNDFEDGPKVEVILYWLEQAANKGHLEATYFLGKRLLDQGGAWVPDNETKKDCMARIQKALFWLKKAVEKNHKGARTLLNEIVKKIYDNNPEVITALLQKATGTKGT